MDLLDNTSYNGNLLNIFDEVKILNLGSFNSYLFKKNDKKKLFISIGKQILLCKNKDKYNIFMISDNEPTEISNKFFI